MKPKKSKTHRQIFDRFLDVHHALDAFYKEVERDEDDYTLDICSEVISGAFSWCDSPQGVKFWSPISNHWKIKWDKLNS